MLNIKSQALKQSTKSTCPLLLRLLLIATSCFVTLSVIVSSNKTTECPKSWVGFGNSCYKFVRSNSGHFLNASSYCESYNSRLVSVNNFEESNFISEWLYDNDPFKRLWLTSALVSYGQNNWQWTGDSSKFINNNELWLQTNSSYERMAFNGAAYAFSQTANKWGLIRVDSNKQVYSFICELTNLNPISNRYLGDRDIDYGFNIHNKSLVPRGPKIVLEPKDVVFDISARSHLNELKLRCVADANPEPTYTWFREDYSSLGVVGIPIDPLQDERITQTDGTLSIFNPNQQSDKGKYYCSASNQFGRVISETVSITFGYILEFNKKRSLERGKENWGKSISCDAPQHHPRVLYYWTKAEFPNFVQEDKRTFISHDGNLYFSSLEKIDRSNYSCQIQSLISSTGRFGPSFRLDVEPASNGQKLQFANGFPKSFPENPLAGQDIRLECMAYGYPTPAYNWSRLSPTTSLPRGYSIRNDGKVLIIPKARIEDEGEYVCKVSSESELLQKTVFVSVQASPKFTKPLENLIVGEREPVQFECEAFGQPKVSYTWFKNGIELSQTTLAPPDFARYSIKENRFSIDSVERERDSAMFQCRASNQHGSSFSSAQLRVTNLRPTSEKDPMPTSIQAMVDENVTIPCYVEAIPKPIITWRKEGQQLEDRSRAKVLPNGLLQIQRIRVSDAGSYECTAENSLGAIAAKTWLIVRAAPVIVDLLPLRREIVKFGEPIKIINCEVQSDNSLEVAHVWLKNGLPIKFADDGSGKVETGAAAGDSAEDSDGADDEQRLAKQAARNKKYFRTDTGQLVIKNVSYVDQANYTCRAQTSLGHVERSGQLLVRGPPDACGSVVADQLGQFSGRVLWTDGAEHFSRIIHNSIEGRTNHNSTWTLLAANITGQAVRLFNQPASGGSFARKTFLLTSQLLPDSIYEFRVSATNELGAGPYSAPSPKYRTEMSAPRFAVQNLRGGGGKAGTLFIRWDALAQSAWGAQEIWYTVYYRPSGSLEWTKRELTSAGGATDAYTVNVGSENHYKLFEVMVQPVNAIGAGPLSQVARIRSAQQMPWQQPTNVHGVAYNSTALNVSWTPMPNGGGGGGDTVADGDGRLTGYKIRYWPSGKDPQTNSLTKLKRGLEPWGLVVGLLADTEYHVSVMAYNEAGSGPESEPFRLRTFKSAPQRAPTSVSAVFLDETTLKVTWRGVAPVTTNEEPVLGYKVLYWRYEESINFAKSLVKPLGGDELSLTISDLALGETYKLRVLAYSSGGDGKMSSPELVVHVRDPNATTGQPPLAAPDTGASY